MIWRTAQSQIPHAGHQTCLTEHGRFFIAYRDGGWQYMPPAGEWSKPHKTEDECKDAANEYYLALASN